MTCRPCIQQSLQVKAACPVCKAPCNRRDVALDDKLDRIVQLYVQLEASLCTQLLSSQLPAGVHLQQAPSKASGIMRTQQQQLKQAALASGTATEPAASSNMLNATADGDVAGVCTEKAMAGRRSGKTTTRSSSKSLQLNQLAKQPDECAAAGDVVATDCDATSIAAGHDVNAITHDGVHMQEGHAAAGEAEPAHGAAESPTGVPASPALDPPQPCVQGQPVAAIQVVPHASSSKPGSSAAVASVEQQPTPGHAASLSAAAVVQRLIPCIGSQDMVPNTAARALPVPMACDVSSRGKSPLPCQPTVIHELCSDVVPAAVFSGAVLTTDITENHVDAPHACHTAERQPKNTADDMTCNLRAPPGSQPQYCWIHGISLDELEQEELVPMSSASTAVHGAKQASTPTQSRHALAAAEGAEVVSKPKADDATADRSCFTVPHTTGLEKVPSTAAEAQGAPCHLAIGSGKEMAAVSCKEVGSSPQTLMQGPHQKNANKRRGNATSGGYTSEALFQCIQQCAVNCMQQLLAPCQ